MPITHLQPPLGPNLLLTLPTPTNPRPATNPPIFNDAMMVRQRVFVDEQHVNPESEIDDDDARSWQWVVYGDCGGGRPVSTAGSAAAAATAATAAAGSTNAHADASADADAEQKHELKSTPIATLRLVPPPHPPHSLLLNENQDQDQTSTNTPKYDHTHEPYIKLTRIAVLPQHRKTGLARHLITTALDWAAANSGLVDEMYARISGVTVTPGQRWNGLVLVHAQMEVEGLYRRMGFEKDEGLGVWREEGILHVGMWRRVDLG